MPATIKSEKGKKQISASRIRQLSALAKKIDTEEKPSIQARGRAVFKRHRMIRDLVRTLKQRRQEAGLSLADMAERTGIAKPNLSRLENSENASPTLETLQRYALALGMKMTVHLN